MNKTLLAILPLVAIVAISGCIQQETTITGGNGMVINEFSSTLDTVSGGDKLVTLYFEAENKGGTTIKDATVCLLGSNLGTTANDHEKGLWETNTTGKPICQGLGINDTLRPYDPINDIPGGTLKARWWLYSPCLAETLTRTDTFTGRVYYKYNTTTTTSIWVYTESELTAAQQRGDAIPSSLVVESTKGPVSIAISAVQPVRAEDGSVTLRITISNTGNGVVFNDDTFLSWGDSTTNVPSILEQDLNKFSADFAAAGAAAGDYTECIEELKNIELRRGESITKSCDIDISAQVQAKQAFPVVIEAEYGYYIDSEVSVVASGKRNDVNCD